MSTIKVALSNIADWAKEDIVRPVLVLVCAMLLFNLPASILKLRMVIRGVVYFFLCWDKSWKKPQDLGSIFGPHLSQALPVQRKTVYFVRHGESTWNDTFNKGKHRSVGMFLIGFFPGLAKAFLYELYLLLAGKVDSWFYDAPLSHLGLSQAEELAAFLKDKPLDGPEAEHIKILRGETGSPHSRFLCSNLRRAVSTLIVGFNDRINRLDDKILIVPSLQEISRNPDTLSITPAHTPIQASWIEKSASDIADFQKMFNSNLDMSLHTGNKPIGSNGLKRMNDFCEFLFSQKEEYFIVGGHSIWFRSFFRMFLPYSVHHASKEKKIVNGGIVTFELMKAETRRGPKYMIDPKTIQVVYGGFD